MNGPYKENARHPPDKTFWMCVLAVIFAVIVIWIVVAPVSAGVISDSLVGKTEVQKAITVNKMMAETYLKPVDQKIEYSPTKTSTKDTYDISIKTVAYEEKTNALKTVIYATKNGKELSIQNPVYWWNPPYVWNDTSKIASGEIKEEPDIAMHENIVRWLSSKPYGKVTYGEDGDPTAVIYPITTSDRTLQRNPAGDTATWADVHDGIGTGSTDDNYLLMALYAGSSSNTWNLMWRAAISFNTSVIGATSTPTSATLRMYGSGAPFSDMGYWALALTNMSPTDPTSLVTGDYNKYGTTDMANRIPNSSLHAVAPEINFTLNAAGLTYINKTGWSPFMIRTSYDADNSFNGTWGYPKYTQWEIYSSNLGDPVGWPYLEVIYSTEVTPVAAFSSNVTSGYPAFNVSFTDSSANTPTSWLWQFGDGDTDTVQNPVHQYDSVIGNSITSYSVNLQATNGAGNDWENKTDYITAYPLVSGFSANITTGSAPLAIGFTDSTTNGTPINWSWDFGGDGTSYDQNPVHTFNTPGIYWISLNSSNLYSWDIENKSAYIEVLAIVADFNGTPLSGSNPLTVNFQDLSTGATSWEWYFGDGSPNATTQDPSHTYTTNGLYDVSLTVSDGVNGDTITKPGYIAVGVPTPTPTPTLTATPTPYPTPWANGSFWLEDYNSTYVVWGALGLPNLTIDGIRYEINVTGARFFPFYNLAPNSTHTASNGTTTIEVTTPPGREDWIIPWAILGFIFLFIAVGSRIPLLLILPIFMSTAAIVSYIPSLPRSPADQYLIPAYVLSLAAAFLAGWWGMRKND